ncbi:nucleoside-diphosphate-sugar epimerase [Halobacteroides halobius DSM 5150]|uniref:Nucleoside-diphosphate-sugar epimerase n=1 Tax=Halobacteroides halobius (strain ATCC 35273 / DSM 5150 / MD-1) TaxID=748449 RepID=L0K9I8_HALHC|nr:GDP-mannose 4,6-dehydratase [Halobacteroides halobius]AGB40768.1 nucleoside-diphosphate-sugar epimerase [Halobacteroides halobius DSM 5150]
MKILVTGGAGFIGSHLVEDLLATGHQVVVVDNFNDYYNPQLKEENILQFMKRDNFKVYRTDILNQIALNRIFKREKIDKVIHLAAMAGVRNSVQRPNLYVDVDIKGTINLLDLANKYNIKQFVFASSSSVYGTRSEVPFREDMKLDSQASPYATAKKSAELFCRNYHNLYDLNISILRFFTVYGPRQRPNMAISKFTRLIDQGQPIPMFGDGSSKRDYTYITDIIKGIRLVLINNPEFEIFNLGSSSQIKLLDLINLISSNLGKKAKLKELPEQEGDVPVTYADITKAKNKLNYRPQVDIEVGIRKFTDWYQSAKSRLGERLGS